MATTISESLQIGHSGNVVRLIIGLLFALFVTAGLFWTMQYLIETADKRLNEGGSGHLIDFVRLKRNEEVERRQLKPKKRVTMVLK